VDLLLITVPFGEDLLLKDLENYNKRGEKVGLGRVVVKVKDEIEASLLVYQLRSITRGILLLKKGEMNKKEKEINLEDLGETIKDIDFSFLKNKKFAVRSERLGNHNFNRMKIMAKIGEEILKKIDAKVDLENPDYIIRYDLIKNKFYIGIDLVGEKSLIKKRYKIKQHFAALNSVLAYLMLIFAEYNGEILLDPMCGSGTILFEALFKEIKLPGAYFRDDLIMFKMFPELKELKKEIDEKIEKDKEPNLYGFDKSKISIEMAKENLNFINKRLESNFKIEFKRLSLDWLDWKFNEKEIDKIITNPPYGIRLGNPKKVENTYRELFYQGSYISKEIVLITTLEDYVKKYTKEFKLKIEKEKPIFNQKLLTKLFLIKPY
jgi:tRNA (guanine6-N2)-methyltransferase